MNDDDMANLVESIKQAGEIKKGIREPSRVFEFTPMDIKAVPQNLLRELTRGDFMAH